MLKKPKARKGKKNTKAKAVKRKLPIQKISIVVLIFAALTGFLFLMRHYFYNASIFTVKNIEVRGEGIEGSYLLDELSGRGLNENIFSLDIKDIEKSIKENYFEVKGIQVKRVFPNKLEFYITRREPVAYIESRYYYPVDNEGVVLRDVSASIEGVLPIIEGVYVNDRDIGTRCSSPKLENALRLLKELSKSNIMESHNVSRIYAANSTNISFFMDDGLQIKIGGEDFRERLQLLKETLKNTELDPRDIQYIDLRFKDVVIGPK